MNIGFLSHVDMNLCLFRLPVMNELVRMGHKVFAIVPEGQCSHKFKKHGIEHIPYNIERESINPFKEVKYIENIYEAIVPLKLDMLHTFTAKPNIYGTFAAKKANVPKVLNLVEGLGSFYVNNTLKNNIMRTFMEMLYKRTFRKSDGCVFVNSDDPKYMLKRGIITKEKVKIIKSVGVDTKKFNIKNYSYSDLEKIKDQNNLVNKTIVMMVARAIWDKGVREYYIVAERLSKKYQDVVFVLVGGTDQGNHSCASETFLKSGKVRWLGHRDDIADLTAITDIYVLPSYREGLPVALMEAAAMSKPIVTTDTIGCREVVKDGYNGFLVPVKDSSMLTRKIETLINDYELRKQFGENGRKMTENEFDVASVVDQYINYYESLGIL